MREAAKVELKEALNDAGVRVPVIAHYCGLVVLVFIKC